MAEELEEYPMEASMKSTTDVTVNNLPLLSHSARENTTQFYVSSAMLLKKLAAFSLLLGIVVAVGALSVIEYFPTQSPKKLTLDTNKGGNEVSSGPLPENSFGKQSFTVQDQLMNIPVNIPKSAIISIDPLVENVSMIEPNVPTFIHLERMKLNLPKNRTSLPTRSEGPHSSAIDFPTVYHPEEETFVTVPVIVDPYNISNYGISKVTIYSEDSQDIIAETLFNVVPQIELCMPKQFLVRDSVNHLIVGGIVTVKHLEEQTFAFRGTTNENGTVDLPNTLADGVYEVEISSPTNSKLQRLKFLMIVFENRRQLKANSFIGRIDLKPNEIEVVLKWDAEPRDLDSHLYASNGKHICFFNKKEENMSLDYDVTSGYGPETVRFTVKPNLKYIYAVHHYAGESTLTHSKAELMFSLNPNGTYLYQVGTKDRLVNGEKHQIAEIARPLAKLWIVFLIDGSTNEMKFFENVFENTNDYRSWIIAAKYFN